MDKVLYCVTKCSSTQLIGASNFQRLCMGMEQGNTHYCDKSFLYLYKADALNQSARIL
jgi:hypothetical protein